jgi:hypothetical protein
MVCYALACYQVYPNSRLSLDAAHVLPVLFPFTTPGKYCYRAMASFVGHVTDMPQVTATRVHSTADHGISVSPVPLTPPGEIQNPEDPPRPNLRRSLTLGISRAASNIKRRGSLLSPLPARKTGGIAVVTSNDTSPNTSGYVTSQGESLSEESLDAMGPEISGRSNDQASAAPSRVSMAGEVNVYARNWVNTSSPNFSFILKQLLGYRSHSAAYDSGASIDTRCHPPIRARDRSARHAGPFGPYWHAPGTRVRAVHHGQRTLR